MFSTWPVKFVVNVEYDDDLIRGGPELPVLDTEELVGLRGMFWFRHWFWRVTGWLLQYTRFESVTSQEWLCGPVPVYRAVHSQPVGLFTYSLVQMNSVSGLVIYFPVRLKWNILYMPSSNILPAASALCAHLWQMLDRVSFVHWVWVRGSLAFTKCCRLALRTLMSFSIDS